MSLEDEYKELVKKDENTFVRVGTIKNIDLTELKSQLSAWQAVKALSDLERAYAYQALSNPVFNIDDMISKLDALIKECEAIK